MEPLPVQKSSPLIPVAIILGFGMIALAIYFTSDRSSDPATASEVTGSSTVSTLSSTPKPVTEADYIKGNPNAPILMIEYSDYDCPFCKQYHATLNQIMDEYGVTGRVAWVYRQFPLGQLHPNSPKVSEAALCVGDIGGNDAFWKFTDQIFEERELDEATNIVRLPEFAVNAGVSREEYMACMESNKMKQAVIDSVTDGFNIGARGTPHTVLIVGNQQAVISAAQPYETVKGIIDNLIQQLDGTYIPSSTPAAQ